MKFLFFIVIIFIIFLFLNVIMDHIELNRFMKAHRKYSDFMSQCFNWMDEMTNKSKQQEFLTYYLENISAGTKKDDIIDKSSKIYQYENHIIEKWGDEIPSLRVEIRDRKIKQILQS